MGCALGDAPAAAFRRQHGSPHGLRPGTGLPAATVCLAIMLISFLLTGAGFGRAAPALLAEARAVPAEATGETGPAEEGREGVAARALEYTPRSRASSTSLTSATRTRVTQLLDVAKTTSSTKNNFEADLKHHEQFGNATCVVFLDEGTGQVHHQLDLVDESEHKQDG
ncbi:hypothetical protein DFJ74DRAFT_714644 [Hyaloraphidium curvatum]|nr:hypothetical protein DFJ74DRAFT_714644 [Hyaloraphidium curvatum]